MLRTLLERRFQLKAHRETREGRVYELTVANDGVKIKPPKEGGCISIDVNHLPPSPPPGEPRRMGNMGGAIICS